jgi:hypothetical protein
MLVCRGSSRPPTPTATPGTVVGGVGARGEPGGGVALMSRRGTAGLTKLPRGDTASRGGQTTSQWTLRFDNVHNFASMLLHPSLVVIFQVLLWTLQCA